MLRRIFFLVARQSIASSAMATEIAARNRAVAFKVKMKDTGIVGNVLIDASDVEAAKVKLMKRYPGCTILSVKEK